MVGCLDDEIHFLVICSCSKQVVHNPHTIIKTPKVYGVTTALLILPSAYRYIALCRRHSLGIFLETTFVTLFVASVLPWSFIYGVITIYCFAANENYYEYANPSVYAKLGVDAHSLSFLSIFTQACIERTWSNTEENFHEPNVKSDADAVAESLSSAGTIIWNDVRSYNTWTPREIVLFQTTMPFFTSYLSRVLMYTSVIMGLPPLSVYSPTISISAVIDPIAIMFFVCDFRQTVNNLKKNVNTIFCLGPKSIEVATTVKSQSFTARMEHIGSRSIRTLPTVS